MGGIPTVRPEADHLQADRRPQRASHDDRQPLGIPVVQAAELAQQVGTPGERSVSVDRAGNHARPGRARQRHEQRRDQRDQRVAGPRGQAPGHGRRDILHRREGHQRPAGHTGEHDRPAWPQARLDLRLEQPPQQPSLGQRQQRHRPQDAQLVAQRAEIEAQQPVVQVSDRRRQRQRPRLAVQDVIRPVHQPPGRRPQAQRCHSRQGQRRRVGEGGARRARITPPPARYSQARRRRQQAACRVTQCQPSIVRPRRLQRVQPAAQQGHRPRRQIRPAQCHDRLTSPSPLPGDG